MKKYKHITIEQSKRQEWNEHSVYSVVNNRSGMMAQLLYEKGWKLRPWSSEIAFTVSDLRDIIDFMENEITK